jgi:hypothetical protein
VQFATLDTIDLAIIPRKTPPFFPEPVIQARRRIHSRLTIEDREPTGKIPLNRFKEILSERCQPLGEMSNAITEIAKAYVTEKKGEGPVVDDLVFLSDLCHEMVPNTSAENTTPADTTLDSVILRLGTGS